MRASDMRRFWDARAREDPYFFVDDRLDYRAPDLVRFWASGQRDLDALLGALDAVVGPQDVALDIGCGVGRLTRVLAVRATRVYALDVSAEMLDRARSHHPDEDNIEWLLGDGRTLAGVPDASIDAAVSHVVFQHIPDPEVTLGYVRELGRVLAPEGWAALQLSNDARVHRRSALARRLWRAARALVGRAPRGLDDPAWRGSPIDLEQLRAAADGAGLALDRVIGAGTQFCAVLLRHPQPRLIG
ncbi:MAG TPA: methyltransferase domain-containing protein [Solirubrobacteraceae bacterium]|nr:methyltransferase domain-containing protein [Solirubrobacteraceae bacterium]